MDERTPPIPTHLHAVAAYVWRASPPVLPDEACVELAWDAAPPQKPLIDTWIVRVQHAGDPTPTDYYVDAPLFTVRCAPGARLICTVCACTRDWGRRPMVLQSAWSTALDVTAPVWWGR